MPRSRGMPQLSEVDDGISWGCRDGVFASFPRLVFQPDGEQLLTTREKGGLYLSILSLFRDASLVKWTLWKDL